MKKLLTGDEAIARGAWEAGVHYAAAYPGTPSTEILENLSTYPEITAEWSSNEKVALESVIGASIAGGRAIASMKHVGVNVAADPLFTFAYTGVGAGTVIVTADEPGQFSSQNEQDNRYYALSAKLPMLEPSDSSECLNMTKDAFSLSERFDVPVLLRMTTRVCHSKSIVEVSERQNVPIKGFERQPEKFVMVPAMSRLRRVVIEDRMAALKDFSNDCSYNFIVDNKSDTGVICSGGCYCYAQEVFGDRVSYLKLGFTNPLPDQLITKFCQGKEKIYVIEENDPYIEHEVQRLGFSPLGKSVFPAYGELTPDVLRKSIYGESLPQIEYEKKDVVNRPPTLCAGCPHRGFFMELGKRTELMRCGDIGCYTLSFSPPYNAIDMTVCMGSGFSIAHGAAKVFAQTEKPRKVAAVMGDSTFFHTGINSLLNTAYNQSPTINVILDNRITGMTGHQENPGSGYTAKGEPTDAIDIPALVKAMGFKHVAVIDPNDLQQVSETLDKFIALDEPSVIITRWPCALKKFSPEDKAEFPAAYSEKYTVDEEKCIGCKLCLKAGCPALSVDKNKKKAVIDRIQCLGCNVCAQLCPKKAIGKEVK
ncbi:MAG: indolepyruvate ferredoxin oxidoreductase subunit alpha [Firmicutes bacterium]|nr:indolepyruvate ferredoxin oxidoreductase subunit alpha [Bacillota bacterium]